MTRLACLVAAALLLQAAVKVTEKTPPVAVRTGARAAIDRMRRDQQAREVALQRDINAALARLRSDKTSVPHNASVPVISAVIGVMQPGGAVVILGKNFGMMPGRVRLTAEGGGWSLDLEDLEWHAGGIGGTLPKKPNVTSLAAKFVVELRSGASSTPWPVQWIADVNVVPAADVGVTCGTDSNSDFCNGQKGGSSDSCAGFLKLPPIGELFSNFTTEPLVLAIAGAHENCWGAFSTDKGTDVYQINLKNGWTLHDFEHWRATKTGASVTDPKGFVKGATSWTVSFDWFALPDSALHYGTVVYIRGPKGIPHK